MCRLLAAPARATFHNLRSAILPASVFVLISSIETPQKPNPEKSRNPSPTRLSPLCNDPGSVSWSFLLLLWPELPPGHLRGPRIFRESCTIMHKYENRITRPYRLVPTNHYDLGEIGFDPQNRRISDCSGHRGHAQLMHNNAQGQLASIRKAVTLPHFRPWRRTRYSRNASSSGRSVMSR